MHRAGPRKNIYYEPGEVKASIVTCGGLCPGLNDVIRQVSQIFMLYLIPILLHRCYRFAKSMGNSVFGNMNKNDIDRWLKLPTFEILETLLKNENIL